MNSMTCTTISFIVSFIGVGLGCMLGILFVVYLLQREEAKYKE